jgi:hypothetical protein
LHSCLIYQSINAANEAQHVTQYAPFETCLSCILHHPFPILTHKQEREQQLAALLAEHELARSTMRYEHQQQMAASRAEHQQQAAAAYASYEAERSASRLEADRALTQVQYSKWGNLFVPRETNKWQIKFCGKVKPYPVFFNHDSS